MKTEDKRVDRKLLKGIPKAAAFSPSVVADAFATSFSVVKRGRKTGGKWEKSYEKEKAPQQASAEKSSACDDSFSVAFFIGQRG